jgi:hypothetical protein
MESKSSWVSAVDARVKEIRGRQAKRSDREGLYETTKIFEGKECQRVEIGIRQLITIFAK